MIESWTTPEWLCDRIVTIKTIIQDSTGEVDLGLMSWAVFNDDEMSEFNELIRPKLEIILGMDFSPEWLLSVSDWVKHVRQAKGLRFTENELVEILDKETVLFWLFQCDAFDFDEVILIDDAVTHNLVALHNSKSLKILNIKQLKP